MVSSSRRCWQPRRSDAMHMLRRKLSSADSAGRLAGISTSFQFSKAGQYAGNNRAMVKGAAGQGANVGVRPVMVASQSRFCGRSTGRVRPDFGRAPASSLERYPYPSCRSAPSKSPRLSTPTSRPPLTTGKARCGSLRNISAAVTRSVPASMVLTGLLISSPTVPCHWR